MKFTRTTTAAAVTAVVATTAVVGGLVVANTGGDDTPDPIVAPATDPIVVEPVPIDPIVVDDLTFTDPIAVSEPPEPDASARDELVGSDAASDVLTGDQPLIDETDDPLVGDAATPSGLRRLCIDVRHQPVPEQNTASGIWVNGSIYGLGDDVWIFVEGPTLNNGTGLEIPVDDGFFDAPIGINQYGDHALERFEIHSGDPTVTPIDLLPTLASGPGVTLPVGPGEGPVFDQECFDFDPPADPAERLQTEAAVDAFFAEFVSGHRDGRTDQLLQTLHPAVPLAFGDEACTEYVERTTGSIVGAEVLSVGEITDFELDTPNGPISFPDAIPFSVEFRLPDDSTVVNDGNLALHDGGVHWLTTCGN